MYINGAGCECGMDSTDCIERRTTGFCGHNNDGFYLEFLY